MNDPEWIMIRDMVAKTRRLETGDYYEVRVWVE